MLSRQIHSNIERVSPERVNVYRSTFYIGIFRFIYSAHGTTNIQILTWDFFHANFFFLLQTVSFLMSKKSRAEHSSQQSISKWNCHWIRKTIFRLHSNVHNFQWIQWSVTNWLLISSCFCFSANKLLKLFFLAIQIEMKNQKKGEKVFSFTFTALRTKIEWHSSFMEKNKRWPTINFFVSLHICHWKFVEMST